MAVLDAMMPHLWHRRCRNPYRQAMTKQLLLTIPHEVRKYQTCGSRDH